MAILEMLNRVSDAIDVLMGTGTVAYNVSSQEETSGDSSPELSKYVAFEREVHYTLTQCTAQYDGCVIPHIYLPYNGGTTEIDCVAILPSHIICVECKCYTGIIYANYDEHKNWVQSLGKGNNYQFYSPVKQNAMHVRALRTVLGLNEEQCESLIVFPDNTKLMKLPTRDAAAICRKSSIPCLNILASRKIDVSFNQHRVAQILKGFAVTDEHIKSSHIQFVQERCKKQG